MHKNKAPASRTSPVVSSSTTTCATNTNTDMDLSQQTPRDHCADDVTCVSSLKEITLIETVTSFLEENGAADVDPTVLRNLAEALSKRIDDSSPGVLHDVTMENSYSSFEAARATLTGQGNHSPLVTQSRSVRDLEEQISTLSKENFNLKLRLYFMEESEMGSRTQQSDKQLSKQLLDAKIDIELLRKTINDKTKLLKEAACALAQHEDMQKQSDMKHQTIVEQLQQHIRHLECTAEETEAKLSRNAEVTRLEEAFLQCQEERTAAKEQIEKLELALNDRDDSLTACENKIQELAIKNAELVEELEKHMISCNQTNDSLELKQTELNSSLMENSCLTSKLIAVTKDFERQNQYTQNSNRAIEAQSQTIHLLENPTDLNAQLADKLCELQEAQEKLKERERIHEQACRTIQKLMQKLSSQEKEIKRLQQSNNENTNVRDTTATTALESRSLSDTEAATVEQAGNLKQRVLDQEQIIKQLRAEVKKKTANLQNLVNKELWEKNREIERLTKLVASKPPVLQAADDPLCADLQQSFTENDYAKAMEANKLLQRKVDVLIKRVAEEQQNDALMAQLRCDLRLAQNDAESANKWRMECADLCGILTNRLEELAGFLNSLLKHKDVLGVLAADRRHAMRKAVDRSLDLSKSLNMTLSVTGGSLADQSLPQLFNLSEILGADADEVSYNHTFNSHEELQAAASNNGNPTIETLRAENKALKRELEKRRTTDGLVRKERRSLPLNTQQQHDNQSESEAWSEPDRKVSLARIGLEETSNSLACEQRLTESDSEGQGRSPNTARQERNRNSERIAQLEQLIAQRDERILNVQCQLVECDNRYKQEQLRVLEITQQLEQLLARNESLQADLQAIGTEDNEQTTQLQQLVELRSTELEQLKIAHNTLSADAQVTEMELQSVQQQFAELEQQFEKAVQQAHNELMQLKSDAAAQLEAQQRQHEQALGRDWISLVTYEEQKKQLMELQRQHVECMRTIEFQQENERELKQALLDNELTARGLKKQLDESALQASKAVMERTKAYNDKLQLEERLEELKQQLTVLKQEQEQQQQLPHQGQQQRQPPKRLNSSDVSQSGYTSEEVLVVQTAVNRAVAAQRINSSSPDLGIESDAGRVSSVELSNAQRTLLKTVELKAEAVNDESDEVAGTEKVAYMKYAAGGSGGGDAATTGAAANHDCAKVDQENAELRRKLIRTKRAFEDTYEKLRLANKAKAQVEKDIKNQILKTHNVLRNVRSNMENEL